MNSHPVLAVVGLGYVGLPVAVAFAKELTVIGFDISVDRIDALKSGLDATCEVSASEISAAKGLALTSDPRDLSKADIIVVCVPTPVDDSKRPDFGPLLSASSSVGKHMKPGVIVVFESTVYPGATEEVCVPQLETSSGLKWKKDFFVGYSPERINPGDKTHNLSNVIKIVAGDTKESLSTLCDLYGRIVKAGIHRAESIRVAEAAKIIENTQRDLNIALVNECSMIFHKMGIDTQAVLEAAGTKWNFLSFRPGLVGGHCIGVDPYYLTEKAMMLGHHPEVILAGRRMNDGMGRWIAQEIIKSMLHAGFAIKGARVAILGLTFKENVSDLRNSRVIDVIHELNAYGIQTFVNDPLASHKEAEHEYGLQLVDYEDIPTCDAVILAVSHVQYLDRRLSGLVSHLNHGGVFADIKSMFPRQDVEALGFRSWRL
jgi:UDP-N-acetyl-D-galactosamine dehydrogenase